MPGYVNLSKGGSSGSIIDTRVVMQYALKANASGIILAHNHPSGNLNPSEADRKITRELRDCWLRLANITLLDHIIIIREQVNSSVMKIV